MKNFTFYLLALFLAPFLLNAQSAEISPGVFWSTHASLVPDDANNTSHPAIAPLSGSGTRLMWIPSRSAFRVGSVSGTQWDATNIGLHSFASGFNSKASGLFSTAMGFNSSAEDIGTVALGYQAKAGSAYSVALGKDAYSAQWSVAIGEFTEAYGINSTAIGYKALATAWGSVSIGESTKATKINTVAIGYNAEASGDSSMALGKSTKATGKVSFATGARTVAAGNYSIAMGHVSKAGSNYSIAMGNRAQATGSHSIAIGNNTRTNDAYAVAIGGDAQALAWGSVALGIHTKASGGYATALGRYTVASGEYSMAAIRDTEASGDYAIAMGRDSKALASYSTVIGRKVGLTSDAEGSVFLADGYDRPSIPMALIPNVFYAKFGGGYHFTTHSTDNNIGVSISGGGNAWQSISDSTLKENFIPANTEAVLNSVSQMRIGTWNYIGQDPAQFRHWGVMAQDFYKYFGQDKYGAIGDDKSIATADFDGVAFAAIKGLEERTRDLKEALQEAQNDREKLKLEIAVLNERDTKKDELLTTLLSEISVIKQQIGLNNPESSQADD